MRWGRFRARQRYRCTYCKRTFSDLTLTPLAYTKRLLLWPRLDEAMREGLPLRRVAEALGIHLATAWRWRHKLLEAMLSGDATRLTGFLELDELCLPWNEKGKRPRHREPRRRGRRPGEWGQPRAWILLALDRRGGQVAALLGASRPLASRVAALLRHRLEGRVTVLSRSGPFGAHGRFAASAGCDFLWTFAPHPGRPRHPLYHAGRVLATRIRLRRWLARFRGVATRYLDRYLVWYTSIDRLRRSDRRWFEWPLASTASRHPGLA